MANKKKSALPSPIQQIVSFAAPKENKSILSLPISDTENYDVEVKATLTADEMASFVGGIINALFLNEEYAPVLYKLIYVKAILAYYTNLKGPISNEDLVSLVFDTDIVQKIEEKINQKQQQELIEAIQKNIESKQQDLLNSKSARLEDAIHQIQLLTEITSKIAEQFKEIDMKQVMESSMKLANIPERDLVNNIIDIKFGKDSKSENADEPDHRAGFNGGNGQNV